MGNDDKAKSSRSSANGPFDQGKFPSIEYVDLQHAEDDSEGEDSGPDGDSSELMDSDVDQVSSCCDKEHETDTMGADEK